MLYNVIDFLFFRWRGDTSIRFCHCLNSWAYFLTRDETKFERRHTNKHAHSDLHAFDLVALVFLWKMEFRCQLTFANAFTAAQSHTQYTYVGPFAVSISCIHITHICSHCVIWNDHLPVRECVGLNKWIEVRCTCVIASVRNMMNYTIRQRVCMNVMICGQHVIIIIFWQW